MSDNEVKIMRAYFEHQSDIEFRFYRVIENTDLYEKLKRKNLGVQYENAIDEKRTYNQYETLREVIAMVDNVDDIIYISPRSKIISEIYLAKQPQSFIHHIDNLNQAHSLVMKENELEYIFIRDVYRYTFNELYKLKNIVDVDEQTKQYRLIPHIEDEIAFSHFKYMCEDILDYIVDLEARPCHYHYAPYDIKLQCEHSRQHNSRIVRQMAEVGNVRHLFSYRSLNADDTSYDTAPTVDWEGDIRRVFTHQRDNFTSQSNIAYRETFLYGHYRDVQALVESDAFYHYYDKSKEVQMSFENLSNGLVVVKLYQFDIKDVGCKYLYFDMYKEGFQTNQQAFVFDNNEQFNINDLNQSMRKEMGAHRISGKEITQPDAKDKLKIEAFRHYLEQI